MSMTPLAPLDRTAATFKADVDTFFATTLPLFVTEANALEANVEAKELAAAASATAADASEAAAAASVVAAAAEADAAAAAAAAAAVTATKWVSGSFTDGDVRWSPIDYLSYRKIGTGLGTTDPSLDRANWLALNDAKPNWITVTADPATAVAGVAYRCDTSGGAFPFTMPAAPVANDRIPISGNFAANPLTINWNGANHFGRTAAADPTTVISRDNVSLVLTFFGDTNEWGLGA